MLDALAHLRECLNLNSALIVALFAGGLYFHLAGKKADKRVKSLYIYGICAVVVLLVPVSASVLRILTGTYYDAPDMWNILPVIPFGAIMCACFAGEVLKTSGEGKKGSCALGVLLLTAAVLLCGSMGTLNKDRSGRSENAAEGEREVAESIVDKSILKSDEVLLAPDDMIAYIHTYSSSVITLYGRDMWDGRLTKNRYGHYSDDVVRLHDDMQRLLNGEDVMASDICERAFMLGADMVILPGESIGNGEELTGEGICVTGFITSGQQEYLIITQESL